MKFNKIICAAAVFAAMLTNVGKVNAGEARTKVRPGIEVLESRGFEGLKGKRVGLVTNPSGVDRNLRSTIDILHDAKDVELVALFGPEHGVRGDAYVGDKVSDDVDPVTGVKVFSIYGKYREPSQEMLEGIDVMVYDIQDVGTRSYTFISSLGLVMRACAKKGIEVMVLDRPNPLGGLKVEGCTGVSPFSPSIIKPIGKPTATELMMLRREARRIWNAAWNLPRAEPLLGNTEPPLMKSVLFSNATPV